MYRVGVRAAALAAALSVSVLVAPSAAADEQRVVCDPETNVCTVVVEDDAADARDNPQASRRRGGVAPVVDDGPRLGDLCYVVLANPQPPASDPVWAGREPGSGKVYMRTCPMTRDAAGVTVPVFVADGEDPPVAVTPAQLAQQALRQLRVPKPTIKRSPSERNADDGVPYTWVNLWTWYWTSPARWRSLSERATAGAVFAEVTVTPLRLVLEPGDGSAAVSCSGPGRPWRRSDGNSAPSDGGCGFRYQRVTTGGPLTATVSIRWLVTWTGSGGAGGSLPEMTTSASSTFAVQQVQAVNR
jgi:hypothetical protein